MTQHDTAHEETEDRFYAQFDSREVELMTLDELAAAFEAGKIHGNTFVCREGESEWLTLAEVAGLGEEEEEQEALPVAPVVEARPPMPERRPDMPIAAETRPPMPSRRPDLPMGGETRPPMPERRPAMSVAPAAVSVALGSSTPQSFAPVTSNIAYSSLDLDETLLRPKRRWGLILGAAAGLALVGGGTVFALNSGASSPAPVAVAANHSQAALTLSNVQPKPSEPAAPAAPSTPEPAAPASDAPKASGSLSDDMKQALLAAVKTRHSKVAAKKGRAPVAAPRRGKAGGSAGLKAGGSAYDPLNGKL